MRPELHTHRLPVIDSAIYALRFASKEFGALLVWGYPLIVVNVFTSALAAALFWVLTPLFKLVLMFSITLITDVLAVPLQVWTYEKILRRSPSPLNYWAILLSKKSLQIAVISFILEDIVAFYQIILSYVMRGTPSAQIITLVYIIYIVLVITVIWPFPRLAVVRPIIGLGGTSQFVDSWYATRGNSLRILGSELLTALPILLLFSALDSLFGNIGKPALSAQFILGLVKVLVFAFVFLFRSASFAALDARVFVRLSVRTFLNPSRL